MRPTRSAEVVVVGGGLSGLAVAAQLLAAGVRDVLVLEGGDPTAKSAAGVVSPAAMPRATASAPAPWDQSPQPELDQPSASTRPPHYALASGSRRGVGGRSLYWHGVVLRIEDWALQDPVWPATVRTALLGTGGVEGGLYDAVERELRLWAMASSGCPWVEADAAFAAWLSEATTGLTLPEDQAASLGPVEPVPRAVRRWGSGGPAEWRAYTPLDDWWERGGTVGADHAPTVLPALEVVEILAPGGRVGGVRVRDGTGSQVVEVGCSTLVLAAGTLENTRLVGQLQAGESGERPVYSGLNDHLTQGFVARVPASGLPPAARLGSLVLAARDSARRCNIFVRLHPGSLADNQMLLDVWAMGEQGRSPANQVSFRAPQPAPWSILVQPGLSPADEKVLAGERSLLASIWARLADHLAVIPRPLCFTDFLEAPRPFDLARSQALQAEAGAAITYAWPLGSGDHEGGTLPLGELLDDVGRLAEVSGVYVAGPATFPRPGAANPSLTTLALARHTVRAICGG